MCGPVATALLDVHINQMKHWSFCFTRFHYHFGCQLIHDLVCSLLRKNAAKFLMDDIYRNPGPLQFDGPGADAKVVTLCVEDQDYMGRIKKLQEYLDKVLTILWSLSLRSSLYMLWTLQWKGKKQGQLFRPQDLLICLFLLMFLIIGMFKHDFNNFLYVRLWHDNLF